MKKKFEINKLVGEFLGWTKIALEWRNWDGPEVQDPVGCAPEFPEGRVDMPDFMNDLNECRKFTSKMPSWDQIDKYLKNLHRIVQYPHICGLSHSEAFVNASAEDRCKALLITLYPEMYELFDNDPYLHEYFETEYQLSVQPHPEDEEESK